VHIAKVYLVLDRKIRAEKALKEILKADPKNKEAMELLKQCI
jgi:hypothetical protein